MNQDMRRLVLARGVNPHVWRKLNQAERNFIKALGVVRDKAGAGGGTFRIWGPMANKRKAKKWASQMLKLAARITEGIKP